SCTLHCTYTMHIYTLSLHDALPIFQHEFQWKMTEHVNEHVEHFVAFQTNNHYHYFSAGEHIAPNYIKHYAYPTVSSVASTYEEGDRKSTRLNSSHVSISYAVFCLKK